MCAGYLDIYRACGWWLGRLDGLLQSIAHEGSHTLHLKHSPASVGAENMDVVVRQQAKSRRTGEQLSRMLIDYVGRLYWRTVVHAEVAVNSLSHCLRKQFSRSVWQVTSSGRKMLSS